MGLHIALCCGHSASIRTFCIVGLHTERGSYPAACRRQRRSSTRRGRTSTVTASPRARPAAPRPRTRRPPPPTPRPPRRCERHGGFQAPPQAAGPRCRTSGNPPVVLAAQRQIQRQNCGHGTGRGAQRSTHFFTSCREGRWVAAPQHLAHITCTMALAHSGTMIDVTHVVHPMTLSVGHWFVEGVFVLASWGLQAPCVGIRRYQQIQCGR